MGNWIGDTLQKDRDHIKQALDWNSQGKRKRLSHTELATYSYRRGEECRKDVERDEMRSSQPNEMSDCCTGPLPHLGYTRPYSNKSNFNFSSFASIYTRFCL